MNLQKVFGFFCCIFLISCEEDLPPSIKILSSDENSITLQYTIAQHATVQNLLMNYDLCRGLHYIAKLHNTRYSNIIVKGLYEKGRFALSDSYGNQKEVEVNAFVAVWKAEDVAKYQCENHPDIWLHSDVRKLEKEFKNDIQSDCDKGNYENKYLLCLKV